MYKLAIVGSRSLENSVEARGLVHNIVKHAKEKHGAELEIISGHAKGIDEMSEYESIMQGVRFKGFPPKGVGWPAFKARNDEMAEYCDELECIYDPNSKTHGCLYTARKAEELGKVVKVHPISIEQP